MGPGVVPTIVMYHLQGIEGPRGPPGARVSAPFPLPMLSPTWGWNSAYSVLFP